LHGKPSDESIKQKYRQFMNDPLKFMKDAIDWNAFPSLLKDLYHNDNEDGERPNIPITTMVKILFLQSLYNLSDQQAEKEIHDRISFMNFLDMRDSLMQGQYDCSGRGYPLQGGVEGYGMNYRGSLIQKESR